jgi:hypothetical protein
MNFCEDPSVISANVRAEIARARTSQRQVQVSLAMSGTRWKRRMSHPDTWTIGELCAVAAELGIPVRQLLAQDR